MAVALVRRRKNSVTKLEPGQLDREGDGYDSKIRIGPRLGSVGALSKLPRRRHTMEPHFDPDPLGLNIAPPSAALAPDTLLGRGRAFFGVPGVRSNNAAKNSADATESITCKLALKHRLMLSEVKTIMKEFSAAGRNEKGGLDRKEFDEVMARIFDVDSIDDHVAKAAHRQTGMQHTIDIEQFLEWYVQNMFTQVNTLNTASDKKESEALIYEIAKTHKVSTMVVDRVKVKFDYFDTDKSGEIDYEEFVNMFKSILSTKTSDDLNPDRLKRFWKEIDHNGDGGVCFSEFSAWYLKYFAVESDDPEDFDMAGPLRAFYDSYNPVVQRRNSLNGISKMSSIN